mmetsp:Transcript_8949/g.36942  ORF Transcript_8949/g.36942 Transcript_8949/m.36942 type:complete len:267 (-) Transcript_8949:296-1096(-)
MVEGVVGVEGQRQLANAFEMDEVTVQHQLAHRLVVLEGSREERGALVADLVRGEVDGNEASVADEGAREEQHVAVEEVRLEQPAHRLRAVATNSEALEARVLRQRPEDPLCRGAGEAQEVRCNVLREAVVHHRPLLALPQVHCPHCPAASCRCRPASPRRLLHGQRPGELLHPLLTLHEQLTHALHQVHVGLVQNGHEVAVGVCSLVLDDHQLTLHEAHVVDEGGQRAVHDTAAVCHGEAGVAAVDDVVLHLARRCHVRQRIAAPL